MSKVYHNGTVIPDFPEPKDPNGVAHYGFDWSKWLQEGEIVSVSQWFCHPDMTIISSDNSTTGTSVALSGGKRRRKYIVTNRVTTSTGRIEDRSIRIEVRNK